MRAAVGLDTDAHDYGQRGLVAYVRTQSPHEDTAWQRFLPTGPLAFLPCADGRSSIVWTLPEAEAQRLLPDGRPATIVVEHASEETEDNDALALIADGWKKIGIKMLTKEDIVPAAADRLLHFLAPVVLLALSIITFAVIPYGRHLVPDELDAAVLYFFAAGAATELAIFMAGWASRNKYSLLAAMRALAQLISYELPLLLAFVPVVMLASSLATTGIVAAQDGHDHPVIGADIFKGAEDAGGDVEDVALLGDELARRAPAAPEEPPAALEDKEHFRRAVGVQRVAAAGRLALVSLGVAIAAGVASEVGRRRWQGRWQSRLRPVGLPVQA